MYMWNSGWQTWRWSAGVHKRYETKQFWDVQTTRLARIFSSNCRSMVRDALSSGYTRTPISVMVLFKQTWQLSTRVNPDKHSLIYTGTPALGHLHMSRPPNPHPPSACCICPWEHWRAAVSAGGRGKLRVCMRGRSRGRDKRARTVGTPRHSWSCLMKSFRINTSSPTNELGPVPERSFGTGA